ncbi:MAG: phosphoenolpyruvate synthase [Deltaproteobacteria bacterium RBG_19FT_COMBO_43_11]|nr:MAG: phosphoenolpyruvate synthase [Deltaproteobacteria bacterium RBG_16_44_11]OGP87338.1 MAG: phosphoenolpyruvate synthase [Deltaproteobacteria bacterium RBG_19FT_COMBO_43_11]
MIPISAVSTGIKGLDKTLNYLQMGDNVVFQVESIEDYKTFVIPYVTAALEKGRRVVYMRFAQHPPILESAGKVATYKLNADIGFESFSTQVHNIIHKEGRDVFYVFDCLSDLLLTWATDLMIGNFFVITCPYLFELNTVAYFSILRNRHSFKTIARIRETAQVLLDVYNYQGKLCVHPVKAWQRYSPTMFLPHIVENDEFVPIMNSADASNLFSYLTQAAAGNAERNLDYWDRIFLQAKDLLESPKDAKEKQKMIEQLARVLIGREKRMIDLVKEYFTLEDLIEIKERLIGTGFIGGKSVGMLLARNILRKDPSVKWAEHLELHDSFYIGSDIFYSYIVQNGWWKALMTHKTKEGYFESARELRGKMLKGVFSEEVRERFQLMLEYYGQSPIIVRSSSLLEDAFGNAFAGKYESYFCANQGTPEERYEKFEEAVRKIFASTMNIDALTYRLQKGLDQQDEQMALLVQRVSGSYRKNYFFPEIAGVGLSYNTFGWKKGMDPKAGLLRLVFGLGTRAVNRVENDYPRIVALDEPLVKPYADQKDAGRFSQHGVDVLNLEENRFQSLSMAQVLSDDLDEHFYLIGSRDIDAMERMKDLGRQKEVWILTFDELLSSTEFPKLMSKMLKRLEKIYDYPVDIEFTANFNAQGKIQINLLQCRPFRTTGHYKRVKIPDKIDEHKILLRQEGNFMGGNVYQTISRIIYIDPQGYAKLPLAEKYSIARLVGKINKTINREEMPTILFGPGRWGTTTPAMGVPVTFAEINNVTAIAEVAYKEGSLIPDLSFGTHFFQDMVEMNIVYLAVYPEQENVTFNVVQMQKMPNILKELMPEDSRYADIVHVYDVREKNLVLLSDIVAQEMVCFFDNA